MALGITGVSTTESAWSVRGTTTTDGVQIDLLIDRADNCITVCEMKYLDSPLRLSKKDAEALRLKVSRFKEETGSRKTIFLAMVTAEGFVSNEHAVGLVDNEVSMKDLFE